MKPIEFKYKVWGGYVCSEPGEMDGYYYPAAEVELLVKAAQNIVKACDATYPNSGCFTLELKAALAAFEGR